jgi:glutamate-1-semialdehyde 2,1-aminomutase
MSVFDPTGGSPRVPHGGTFNANPVTMAAGLASLRPWTPQAVARLEQLGDDLRRRANEVLDEADFPMQVTGQGSLFRLVPGKAEVVNYRSVPGDQATRERQSELYLRMLGADVILGSKGTGALSTPMDRDEVNRFVEQLERVVQEMSAG